MTAVSLGRSHQVALVLLRILIGWHFAYEGYFKLLNPAWSRAGEPLERFSAAGYLQNATGPFANLFHALARPALIPYVDTGVAIALFVIGMLLMLGLLTQLACMGAMLLLTLFYVSAIPLTGLPQPRSEGAYLVVNKNLIELAAVAVILVFHTGRIAGLDSLRRSVRTRPTTTRV